MDAWLTQVRDTIAAATGIPASDLEIDEADARELLDLARVARTRAASERTRRF